MFKTASFQLFRPPVTMLTRYINRGATKNVLRMVRLSNPTFGKLSEKMLIEYYRMEHSLKSCYDAKYSNANFEIKASRMWGNKLQFKWQHIMPTYSTDYLLLVALYPKGPRVYLLKKSTMLDIHNEHNNAFNQGQNGNQGLWFHSTDSRLLPYMVRVVGDDLDSAIKKAKKLNKEYKTITCDF